jgi:hypothetical protein
VTPPEHSDPGAGSSSYVEGERVFGPPQGTYDADWVASAAREADPGLPRDVAVLLARQAWQHLRETGVTDPPEIARRLLADNRAAGATAANVVAVAAVRFCAAYDVDPQG